jgi:hypothetical protein
MINKLLELFNLKPNLKENIVVDGVETYQPKYRLIEARTIQKNGVVKDVKYRIEKRHLSSWVVATFLTIQDYYNGMLVHEDIDIFNDLETATQLREFMEMDSVPYKGNSIKAMYHKTREMVVYVNETTGVPYSDGLSTPYYPEYHSDIDKLKAIIDKRIDNEVAVVEETVIMNRKDKISSVFNTL